MPEQPQLYLCRVTFGEDQREERFGIREIRCDAQNGFCINGKRIILRGACIHHDNGLLGACAYDYAEYRKIRILKENGYNAIRSAHNPCSKAMLRACDELGMLGTG
ncbi:MAG: glycoside hydrolase family 2 TIM barrel-domain containing protein [Waltera sp.]